MKPTEFKQIIKEAVKEAIQDELKDILLEALKSPKTVVTENVAPISKPSPMDSVAKRQMYMNLLEDMGNERKVSMTTNDIPFVPTTTNTAAEGTSLPQGSVSMDQIMGLLKGGS